MKNLTAKNQSLTLEENIHAALKREFGYAESVIDGEEYNVGNDKRSLQILWERNATCDYSIATLEGRCYGQFTYLP
jgi:hypothetical protein